MKGWTWWLVFTGAAGVLAAGCGAPTANNGSTHASNAGTSIVKVLSSTYDPKQQMVTLTVQRTRNGRGENVIDMKDREGLVNYSTAQYPSKPIKAVRTLVKGDTKPTPTGLATLTANYVQYVEPVHGWVSYHSRPSIDSPVVGRLQLGQRAPVIRKINAWWYEVRINGRIVYITTNTKYIRMASQDTNQPVTTVPSDVAQPTPAPSPSPAATPPVASTSGIPIPPPGVTLDNSITPRAGVNASRQAKVQAILDVARSKLGTPYVWGHNEDDGEYGFDCSNFAEYVYHHALGYKFTTSSRKQYQSVGVPIARSQMAAGDLIIFNQGGHVGICAGNNQVIQEGGGLAKVGYLDISPGHYWSTHITVVKRMF